MEEIQVGPQITQIILRVLLIMTSKTILKFFSYALIILIIINLLWLSLSVTVHFNIGKPLLAKMLRNNYKNAITSAKNDDWNGFKSIFHSKTQTELEMLASDHTKPYIMKLYTKYYGSIDELTRRNLDYYEVEGLKIKIKLRDVWKMLFT